MHEHQVAYLSGVNYEKSYATMALYFTVPTQPAEPNYAAATSAVAVSKLEADYDLKQSKFEHCQNADQALAQQYIDTVPSEHIASLKKGLLGYHGVTIQKLLQHLHDNYGEITAEDLNENETRIKEPWSPHQTTSIETFWQQHTDGKEYTAQCNKGKIDDDRLIIYATANIRATC